jgi:hypothetical protein
MELKIKKEITKTLYVLFYTYMYTHKYTITYIQLKKEHYKSTVAVIKARASSSSITALSLNSSWIAQIHLEGCFIILNVENNMQS